MHNYDIAFSYIRRNYARPTEKEGDKGHKSRKAATDYIRDKLLRLKLTSDRAIMGEGGRERERVKEERWRRVREWLRLFSFPTKLAGREVTIIKGPSGWFSSYTEGTVLSTDFASSEACRPTGSSHNWKMRMVLSQHFVCTLCPKGHKRRSHVKIVCHFYPLFLDRNQMEVNQ